MQKNEQKINQIKQRILQLIDVKGISKREFCKIIGINPSHLGNSNLKSDFSGDILSKILLNFKEVSSDWLLTGNGKMLKDMSIDEVNETLPIYSNVDYKEKYYELLEENRELRLKIDKQAKELDELRETYQKQVQETEKCKKELAKFRKEKNNNAMLQV